MHPKYEPFYRERPVPEERLEERLEEQIRSPIFNLEFEDILRGIPIEYQQHYSKAFQDYTDILSPKEINITTVSENKPYYFQEKRNKKIDFLTKSYEENIERIKKMQESFYDDSQQLLNESKKHYTKTRVEGNMVDRAVYAYNYLKGKRILGQTLSHEQILGILGNLAQESRIQANPSGHNDGGLSAGAAQWHKGRMKAMLNYLKAPHVSQTTLEGQLDFLIRELNTTEINAGKKLLATKTIEDATLSFSKYYERPGTPHNKARVGYALGFAEHIK